MRIVFIEVSGFRGIKQLYWMPAAGLNCLIGAGDSGKTTLLDAVELLLSERFNATFSDLDFYGASRTEPIRISAVVTGLPKDFLRDDRYGLCLSGWNDGALAEEPDATAGYIPALELCLEVDTYLEPRWFIRYHRQRREDTSRYVISADRKNLLPARLGTYADRHLSWAKGSALYRFAGEPETLSSALQNAARASRDTFAREGASALSDAIEPLSATFSSLGVRQAGALSAGLDYAKLSVGSGGIALHHGDVPLRCMGTGSARLVTAALQSAHSSGTSFLIIDEIEYGLEPHRVALLVNHLRQRTEKAGQAFFTTHSPAVLREVRFSEIHVCRRDARTGEVTIASVDAPSTKPLDAKRYARDKGEAFLGQSVLVCEGQTEIALLNGFFSRDRERSFQTYGVVLVDGGGEEAPKVAKHFRELGYRTGLLIDNDKPLDPALRKNLQSTAVEIFTWQNECSTEEQLFEGLSHHVLPNLLTVISKSVDDEWLRTQLSKALRRKVDSIEPADWAQAEVRQQIGRQAHVGKWIKRDFDLCFLIGRDVVGLSAILEETEMTRRLGLIRTWMTENA